MRTRTIRCLGLWAVFMPLLAGCGFGTSSQSGMPSGLEEGSAQSTQSHIEPLASTSAGAGKSRTSLECEASHSPGDDLGEAVRLVNGAPPEQRIIADTSSGLTPWSAFNDGPSVPRTSEGPQRVHLIGMGDGGVGLANPQFLADPQQVPPVSQGLWSRGEYRPFTGKQVFLPRQLPYPTQSAPIAGTISSSRVVWLEQLVPAQGANASEFAWRVVTTELTDGAPVLEVASSFALTRHEELPAPTPWRAPVTDGKHAIFEAALRDEDGMVTRTIVYAPFATPGEGVEYVPGRLPIAVGEESAWVEDTTNFGIDAENDTFTIRWKDAAHEPLALELGSFYKVQWLEGNDRYLMVALQDTCRARTWLGRFDRQQSAFTGWVFAPADRVAASLAGNVLVWGNGSGNYGPGMFRWDLAEDEVNSLGENPGYSIPFSGGSDGVAVPQFPRGDEIPLVRWGWYSSQ